MEVDDLDKQLDLERNLSYLLLSYPSLLGKHTQTVSTRSVFSG